MTLIAFSTLYDSGTGGFVVEARKSMEVAWCGVMGLSVFQRSRDGFRGQFVSLTERLMADVIQFIRINRW